MIYNLGRDLINNSWCQYMHYQSAFVDVCDVWLNLHKTALLGTLKIMSLFVIHSVDVALYQLWDAQYVVSNPSSWIVKFNKRDMCRGLYCYKYHIVCYRIKLFFRVWVGYYGRYFLCIVGQWIGLFYKVPILLLKLL